MTVRPISLPKIGFGMTAISDMPNTYGYSVDERQARETLEVILSGPPVLIDTSRNYGSGRSEVRVGAALEAYGGLPEGFVLSTKLDRDMETRRFDAEQARRSMEESLKALGVDQFDLLHLHDPEYASHLEDVTRKGGALDELFKMKEEGWAKSVGLAAGRTDIMLPLLKQWDFDALITHNRFTLLNQHAESLIDQAVARGVAVINAAPFAGGLLGKGSASGAVYVYQKPSAQILKRVQEIEAICARHGVPLGAAALHASMREPRIANTLCGVSKTAHVALLRDWVERSLPEALWQDLSLLPIDHGDPEATRTYEAD